MENKSPEELGIKKPPGPPSPPEPKIAPDGEIWVNSQPPPKWPEPEDDPPKPPPPPTLGPNDLYDFSKKCRSDFFKKMPKDKQKEFHKICKQIESMSKQFEKFSIALNILQSRMEGFIDQYITLKELKKEFFPEEEKE